MFNYLTVESFNCFLNYETCWWDSGTSSECQTYSECQSVILGFALLRTLDVLISL